MCELRLEPETVEAPAHTEVLEMLNPGPHDPIPEPLPDPEPDPEPGPDPIPGFPEPIT
jgi:hypothetical protein